MVKEVVYKMSQHKNIGLLKWHEVVGVQYYFVATWVLHDIFFVFCSVFTGTSVFLLEQVVRGSENNQKQTSVSV